MTPAGDDSKNKVNENERNGGKEQQDFVKAGNRPPPERDSFV
jgi:hypothetical protein